MVPMSEWVARALCRSTPKPDIFFPSVPAQSKPLAKQTKLICSMCDVQQECLDYAIAHNEEGFWGGKTRAERDALPEFIRQYIASEYERLGLLQKRLNIDGLILATRQGSLEKLYEDLDFPE